MFTEKAILAPNNSSPLRFPPVSKTIPRTVRIATNGSKNSSLTNSMENTSENVTALKAKYLEYSAWLKTSTRQNREPLLTDELVKHSLCQMGINSHQADQLVSTCKWYVYQFHKNLQNQTMGSTPPIRFADNPKPEPMVPRYQKKPKVDSIKQESNATITSQQKEVKGTSRSNISPRNHYPLLPSIHVTDSSSGSRLRRVDFDKDKPRNILPHHPTIQSHSQHSSQPSESRGSKRSALMKNSSLTSESSSTFSTDNRSLDLDYGHGSSQNSVRRPGFVNGQGRFTIRKLINGSPSLTPNDSLQKRTRTKLLTPTSVILDDVPLGTRSQRLFGGSECFAQIMNELEEQQNSEF